MNEVQMYYSVVTAAFEKWAPFYDLIASPLVGVRQQVVRFAAAPPGSKILDVATGTGAQALAFGRQGYEVIGIDLSEAMLAVARKKNHYPNVIFRAADATSLPFAVDSFDVTCISFALHDMPLVIREKVLREIVRVTKPEGSIIVIDYGLPEYEPGRSAVYGIVSVYEQEYYRDFIHSDLRALLKHNGMDVLVGQYALLGAVRMLKGRSSPANRIPVTSPSGKAAL